ncbi:MAG: repeat-containing protein [Verrucomicrobia bacterium]|nr:repeat-containing protein [Verrucomicrobiota bacterium]
MIIGALAALAAIAVDSLFSFPLDREIPPLFAAVLVGAVLQSAKRGRSEGRSDSAGALVLPAGSRQHGAVGFVVIVAAVGMGVWHSKQWEADGYFKQQLAAMRRADWAEVVRLGVLIQQSDPTRLEALRLTGRAQYQLGEFDEAWMDLKLMQQYVPDDALLLYYLSQCAQKRGQFGEAEKFLTRAAAILPGEALFPHHLGLLYLAQRDAPVAIRELQRAAELNPQDATVYFNLGLAYEQAGRKEEAVVSYRKALESRPGWEEAKGRLEGLKK